MADMKHHTLIIIAVAAIAAIAGVLAGILLLAPFRPADLSTGTQLNEPRPLPAFNLTRDDQQQFTRNDLEGQWTLVFFGFTHCPDVCPNTLFLLDRVVDQLGQDEQPPQVLFVSVDPERDTPEQIRDYLDYFNPDFIGVTGDAGNLQTVASAMSVAYELRPADHEDGAQYEVIHSSAVLVINPNGQLHALFTPPLKADEMTTDLRTLIKSY